MATPFVYDKYVTGKNFIGRKAESVILSNLIQGGENVVIYEPPKSGKTSLIQQTIFSMRVAGKQFLVGQMSCMDIRSISSFLTRFGTTVIRMVAATPSEYADIISTYLQDTHFVFDRAHFSETDEVVSLNWDPDEADIIAMFRLPYRLAADKGSRMLLLIDEFQNIRLTEDGDLILKPMESVIKDEPKGGFSYILSGSMVNAMKEIFEVQRYFYRHVEHLLLNRPDERDIVDRIVKGFLSSGKVIDRDLLMGSCALFRNNLWYINHFSAICDARSKGYIMEPVLIEALDCLLAIHEPRFKASMNDLTTHQVSLLRAIIDGFTRFSSSEVVQSYHLNSSANVKRVKDALMKKEIITFDSSDKPVIIDPLFEYWVRRYFFNKKD